MKKYQPHPFSTLVEKLMPEAEIKELAERIKEFGLREKGKLFQSMILDGRHRQAACELAGIPMEWEKFQGTEREAFEWVIDKNITRRQLNAGQRAMAIAAIERVREHRKWTEKQKVEMQVPDNKEDNTPSIDGPTAKQDAVAVHVSPRSIERARRITKRGTPALVKMAATGVVGLITADAVSKLPKRTQQKLVAQGPKAVVEAAEDVRHQESARDFSDAYNSAPAKSVNGLAKGSTMSTLAMKDKLGGAEAKVKQLAQQKQWADFFVERIEACYEEKRKQWHSPTFNGVRTVVDAIIKAVRA